MQSHARRYRGPRLRSIHEALFSVNTGLIVTQMAITAGGWSLIRPLITMEMYINYWLHIRQTDFVRGYFAFYVPATTITLCIWIALRLTSRSRLTDRLLYSMAGPLIVIAMPTYWHYMALKTNLWGWYGSQSWRFGASPFEAIFVLAVIFVYLYGKWPLPWWTLLPLLAMHFFFWAMPIHEIAVVGSPIVAPLVGFCASSVWIFYIEKFRAYTYHNVAELA